MSYIEREALLKYRHGCDRQCKDCDFAIEGDSWCEGELFAVDVLRLPAADVRPVVFCKDCDLWNEWDSSGKESLGNFRCSCAYWSVEDGPIHYTAKTDFCSYGEKKEET